MKSTILYIVTFAATFVLLSVLMVLLGVEHTVAGVILAVGSVAAPVYIVEFLLGES